MVRKPPHVSDEDIANTRKMLRVVYGVILPRMNRGELRSGFARPSYQNAFVRNHAVFRQLAVELGENWYALMAADDAVPNQKRLERRHMEDAAEEILALVEKMPKPVQDVVIRRAVGMSWRKIAEVLPSRAVFSLQDDWDAAVIRVWLEAGDAVRRLFR